VDLITSGTPFRHEPKNFVSAERFCRVYEEVRNFFRARSQRNESVSLAWQRTLHLGRMRALMTTLAVVQMPDQ